MKKLDKNKVYRLGKTDDGKGYYYLEPILISVADEMEKNLKLNWTTNHIRNQIPEIQKHYIAYKALKKWLKQLDEHKGETSLNRFLATEIRNRCKID